MSSNWFWRIHKKTGVKKLFLRRVESVVVIPRPDNRNGDLFRLELDCGHYQYKQTLYRATKHFSTHCTWCSTQIEPLLEFRNVSVFSIEQWRETAMRKRMGLRGAYIHLLKGRNEPKRKASE